MQINRDWQTGIYSVELRHAGLQKFRIVRGRDRYVVEQKAQAQNTAWDTQWEKQRSKEVELRLMKSKEVLLSDTSLKKLYDDVLYRMTLRSLHELFEADRAKALDSIVVGLSAVRDLYGTIVNEGAIKGILVTTAA